MDKDNKPTEPLAVLYADAKATTTMAVRNVMKAFPLPLFMFESIVEGVLCDIRNEAKMELTEQAREYAEQLKNHSEKEKQEMIERFENPVEEVG